MSENASITRGEQVKSKVLHAAAKLFLEKGFTESRMREISTLAGVSYG
ncbi:MAG: TetR family transcriptional regulator, partial [Clostridia bacterium]|nr:TetR family transcriptional regulator [Clostridia bacterium]